MILTAHSGSDHTPENSFEFIEACIKYGVECLEVDVQRADDGVLYLSHDALEHSDTAIKLVEVLERIKETSIKINCDLKMKNCEMPVITMLENEGFSERFFLSGSVNLNQVPRLYRKQVLFNIENYFTSIPSIEELKEDQLESFCLFLKLNQVEVVNMHYSIWSSEIESLFNRYKLTCSLWTIETYEDYLKYKDKVFNITSRCAFLCLERMKV